MRPTVRSGSAQPHSCSRAPVAMSPLPSLLLAACCLIFVVVYSGETEGRAFFGALYPPQLSNSSIPVETVAESYLQNKLQLFWSMLGVGNIPRPQFP
ncbi:uncharacterized protein LOC119628327 isoform X2 [Bombyx mori]|uniref:uncharacterized protein LOC119628327 isoform X2 n=1 Tax=Bombyx mori TaxID=7091 RepID=UPI002ED550D9